MLKVTMAALRHAGPPEQVFTGHCHAKAIEAAFRGRVKPGECQEGFVLSDGSFVHRVAAMEVARAAGQVRQEYPENEVLFSYMLKEEPKAYADDKSGDGQ